MPDRRGSDLDYALYMFNLGPEPDEEDYLDWLRDQAEAEWWEATEPPIDDVLTEIGRTA